MQTFLFLLIVLSGLEIVGYPVVDVIFLVCFLFFTILTNQSQIKVKVDWFAIFCIYVFTQIIRGMIVLSDLRMIYWILFFLVLYVSHNYLHSYYKRNLLNQSFIKQVFKYSTIYFFIYLIIGVSIRDADKFQGVFWVGSSGAFLVIIPFICAHFCLVSRGNYSLTSLKIPSLMIVVVCSTAHGSRVDIYILVTYLFILLSYALIFKFRKSFLILIALVTALFAWQVSRDAFSTGTKPGQIGKSEAKLISNATNSKVGIRGQQDIDRILMLISISDKFFSSPVEMLIGSGWYTSRFTLKPYELKNRREYGLDVKHLQGGKPLQVNSLAAIISDLGVIGLIFIIYFFYKSAVQIIKSRSRGYIIFLIFLMANWLFFLVAYSTTSILSFLLFLPNGIIVSLSRLMNANNYNNLKVTK